MERFPFKRLVAVMAFALGFCLPLQAYAALVQVCEDDALTRAPVPAQDANHTSECGAAPLQDDDISDTNAAPLCDPRGVSAVAPLRIHPIVDARIEAGLSCGGEADAAPKVGPRSSDPAPMLDSVAASSWAVLVPDIVLPLPIEGEMLVPSPPVTGAALPGFRQGIYHPPR
ncbi:hypothetical protein [Chondromyces apiculatus]|uniref:Secreted protein n=1 Tax=Chondromyces apiculatus DSM 436 TaxID=1192034 RepID=A0A017T838_9BACT|nr:hypothetical protein [Chondromyces apiculatus]EYF05428.1 Hypothetical protein CAP_3345 [Chondromyces apiculatus DSM 436]